MFDAEFEDQWTVYISSSSENLSQDKSSTALSPRNVMSPVKGNRFFKHLKCKVPFCITKETGGLAGKV
jgi:hypothetical protein